MDQITNPQSCRSVSSCSALESQRPAFPSFAETATEAAPKPCRGPSCRQVALAQRPSRISASATAEADGAHGQKDVFRVGHLRAYLPGYRTDHTQKTMARTHNFSEIDVLNCILPLLPEHSVVLDIGANIGNHSLFFGSQKKVDRVIAFEPIASVCEILRKNLELNDLLGKVEIKSFALSDEDGKMAIAFFDPKHTGSTALRNAKDGTIEARKLDSIAGELALDRIDFVKLDVEGSESFVLAGARRTFEKFHPLYVQVEIHEVHPIKSLRNQFPNGDAIRSTLAGMGYELEKKFPDGRNYLYKRTDSDKGAEA
ncbi:MAG: FkbM family methyltransferase [Puniceicoccales bacterium]|jgi:FkbM family methyltransferase|nr:FkbM family methyltransferase [Puniceicoccales bacterium]